MRILETLTQSQQINLLSGSTVGIFETVFDESDAFKEHHHEMCVGYYIYNSADKPISPAYDKYIELTKNNPSIPFTPEQLIGQLIRSKFIDKWNRVYLALVESEYDPITNKDITSKKTATNKNTDTYDTETVIEGTDTDTITYDTVKAKEGSNTDTTTFDTNVEDDGKVGTHATTSRSVSNADDVYGFNSTAPVGDTTSTENTEETLVGDSEKNTTHNVQTKTGTESKQFGIDESETHTGTEVKEMGKNESEKHTGTDTTDISINETMTNKGRDVSGATLIDEELKLRNTQQFFDIVYKDIDSITALQIYI